MRIEQVAEPDPGPGEVKVRPLHNGLCGTDLHQFFVAALGPTRPPIVIGHEFSAEVIEVGTGVSRIAVGDLVAVDPLWSCGRCPSCRHGDRHLGFEILCHGLGAAGGGLSELTVVREEMAHRVPEGVDAVQAALVEPMSVAYHGVLRGHPTPGAAGSGVDQALLLLIVSSDREPFLVRTCSGTTAPAGSSWRTGFRAPAGRVAWSRGRQAHPTARRQPRTSGRSRTRSSSSTSSRAGRRRVVNFNVTAHPTSAWVIQQLRDAFPDPTHRHLIFDNDAIFSAEVARSISRLGTRPRRTALQSPWQNGTAERFVGSVRRELLDHVVVLSEDHLRRLLQEYVHYYNRERVHTSIGDAPEVRGVEERPSDRAKVISLPRVGGLHHRYAWAEAAEWP